MVTLPSDFVKTKIPGYFWSVDEQWLYSIKSGKLKFLVRAKFRSRNGDIFNGWTVSENGNHRYLSDEYLKTLNEDQSLKQEIHIIRKSEHKPIEKYKTKHYKNRKYHHALDFTR